ncbi:MAG TPA: amino acid permease [Candidatus Heimdallarchaeota archaeon]|nr:amino acid permease [Candidatus Heimdallarchaeota archaeon]
MTELKKDLRLYGLTMVAIGSCIGSGIFLTPSQIAGYLPSPIWILLVWALGGVITLTGALTFAELGSMFPQAGGVYVYLKEAYGELFGFLYGWAYLLVITSGANAALSIACAYYLAFIFPLNDTGIKITAVVALIVVTAVNILRVRAAEVFANVFTGLKLLGVAAVIVIGIIWGKARADLFHAETTASTGSLVAAFGLALIGVLWSYGGWQHATFVAGEARDARRTIPRAMIIGALVVAVVYLLTNVAYLFMLPVDAIAASNSLAADAISTLLPFGGILIALLIAISTFGTLGIYTLSAPRIYYAMSRDGLFFKKLAWVHPRFRTPVYAILVQSAWAVVLLLFWGTFEDLITYVVFTDWIFFGLTAAGIFIFRRKLKDHPRPYRTLGYPVVPIIFISITFLFVLNSLLERPLHAWAGLILMALALPVFFTFKKQRKKINTT